ncbi:hypothetical protein AB7714_05730 [Tardiphaga sp. 1201_B9_N1_1]|uniref:hypothetical protein n=1 Tax=unclassified Tardiphaga TaxID=2631404 RepID=UPI003F24988B
MTADLPTSYLEWETALTRHFLSIGEGDASPLRSFEVTDYTLSDALGVQHELREGVVEAFRSTFVAREDRLFDALQHADYRKFPGDEIPGCFGYLALTMLVEGMIDPDASGHEFRPKLTSFLRTRRTFSNLAGINRMWLELDEWLNVRARKGLPFRALELPPPEEWRKQIGYSVRLSFPSRKDKSVVQHFLDENDGVLGSPLTLLDRFRRVADGTKSSAYLKAAYRDFQRSYLTGHRALADHRFWRLVQAISLGRKTIAPFEVSLEMVRDEDDLWSFTVSDATSGKLLGSYGTLAQAVEACSARDGHELMRAIDLGVIFFRQIGIARWEAMPILVEGLSRVIVGLSQTVSSKIGAKLGPLGKSGSWSLSRIVPAGSAQDRIGVFVRLPKPEEQIRNVRVFGGVRSAGEWLGRPSFLPKVSADAAGLAIAPRGGVHDGTIRCEEEAGGTYAIRSVSPLDGSYVVRPSTDPEDESPSWLRSLTFVKDAHVHVALGAAKGLPVAEWGEVVKMRETVASPVADWSDLDSRLGDLIETVYAGGASGWNENELIPILADILCGEVSPWDMLRSLHEASVLEPFLKPAWKGRTWMLRRPTLAPLDTPDGRVVVVDGGIGARQTEDFRMAVEAMGGKAFRAAGAARWSPPLVGAILVEPEELATRLRWNVGTLDVPGEASACFVQTQIGHESFTAASFWSWKKRRFVTARDDEGEVVRLTRWKSGRDHDVYVVVGRGKELRHVSRHAAIGQAHVLRGVPMFGVDGGRLVRSAAEGALPIPAAAWLRYRNFRNAGPVGLAGYSYVASPGDLANLRRLLPGTLSGEGEQSALDAANVRRRSGGASRLLWINDSIRAARMMPSVG